MQNLELQVTILDREKPTPDAGSYQYHQTPLPSDPDRPRSVSFQQRGTTVLHAANDRRANALARPDFGRPLPSIPTRNPMPARWG